MIGPVLLLATSGLLTPPIRWARSPNQWQRSVAPAEPNVAPAAQAVKELLLPLAQVEAENLYLRSHVTVLKNEKQALQRGLHDMEKRVATLEGGLWAEARRSSFLARQLQDSLLDEAPLSAKASSLDNPLSMRRLTLLVRDVDRRARILKPRLYKMLIDMSIAWRLYAAAFGYLGSSVAHAVLRAPVLGASIALGHLVGLYARVVSIFPAGLIVFPKRVPRRWRRDPSLWHSASQHQAAHRLVLASDW
jgi:hypothetical protein